jgi:hypothetical protein
VRLPRGWRAITHENSVKRLWRRWTRTQSRECWLRLYVHTAKRKLTRQEYIDALYTRPLSLTRFAATVVVVIPS